MQTHFEQDLEKLKNRIIKMGNLAIQQTSLAIKILLSADIDQIETIAKTEHEIDRLDVKVDLLCQRIFALKQPVAKDLRFIMSSLRIGNELERIGDIAMSIVNKSVIISEKIEILDTFNVESLLNKSYSIIDKSFKNYTFFDADKINEVLIEAKELKEECQIVLDKVIEEMTQKNEVIIVATNLILILRQIERLADHASNIVESIFFMNEGTIIKHSKNKQEGI